MVAGVALMATMLIRHAEFFSKFADDTYTQKLTHEMGASYVAGENVSLKDWPTEKNITLEKTDIRLSCTTQGMRADVTIAATADVDIVDQTFALFSNFTVDEVYVDGEKVTFERSYDGIMVKLPSEKRVGETIELILQSLDKEISRRENFWRFLYCQDIWSCRRLSAQSLR